MTSVLNDPTTFAQEQLRGFALLHRDLVTAVPGGVVRADRPEQPSVAVVVGGGTGHYPAFSGWVGPGMADGAVVGDVFASPSAEQIVRIATAADNGGGILLTYGNYAGDVLNFGQAEERLRALGLEVTNLPITDDVTSAHPEERDRRRGTAGDLVVIKVAGAAAAAGADLPQVTRLATHANDRTFSFGIAFAGCTLPGADHPLFGLPPGLMGVGMGVHGEPGISEEPVAPAAALAGRLVDRLLEERPPGAGPRIAVLLNGLGATKYEELFLLWGEVHDRLAAEHLEVVAPRVGELVTSLDMAGLSLTICWLDEDLESLWTAPGTCPAFDSGTGPTGGRRRRTTPERATPADPRIAGSTSPASAANARLTVAVANAVLDALRAAQDDLGALDAVAGDGDHGLGMTRGAAAAAEAVTACAARGAGLATTVGAAGDAWAARSGGTSGALWGTALCASAQTLRDDRALSPTDLVAAVTAARDGLVRVGHAEVGDKTMLDALIPFLDELAERISAGHGALAAWEAAADVATTAAGRTSDLEPRRGRARPLAERSLGHADPGATSLALVLTTAGRAVRGTAHESDRA